MPTAEITRPDRSFAAASSFSDLLCADLTEKERLVSTQAAASRPEPVPRIVPVRARGKMVHFRYLDNWEPRPTWFMPVLQAFANLATLAVGWDGYGAANIGAATINRALRAIEQLLPQDAPAPSIVPIPDSGLQIEWHRNHRDLEIEFRPGGDVGFYYFDENNGEEHEGPVGPNFVTVKEYLDRMW
jgi:hypothetical protein